MSPKPTPKSKTPLERMTELTRRLVQVPKSQIPTKRTKAKRRKHQ